MPLYDYNCRDCGPYEAQNPIATRHDSTCPTCGGPGDLKISPVAFDIGKMGKDPVGFPTFADKWAKRHEREAKRGTTD